MLLKLRSKPSAVYCYSSTPELRWVAPSPVNRLAKFLLFTLVGGLFVKNKASYYFCLLIEVVEVVDLTTLVVYSPLIGCFLFSGNTGIGITSEMLGLYNYKVQ